MRAKYVCVYVCVCVREREREREREEDDLDHDLWPECEDECPTPTFEQFFWFLPILVWIYVTLIRVFF